MTRDLPASAIECHEWWQSSGTVFGCYLSSHPNSYAKDDKIGIFHIMLFYNNRKIWWLLSRFRLPPSLPPSPHRKVNAVFRNSCNSILIWGFSRFSITFSYLSFEERKEKGKKIDNNNSKKKKTTNQKGKKEIHYWFDIQVEGRKNARHIKFNCLNSVLYSSHGNSLNRETALGASTRLYIYKSRLFCGPQWP